MLHVIARMNVGGTATYIDNLIKGLNSYGVKNLLAIGSVPKGEAEDSVVEDLNIVRIFGLSRELNPLGDFRAYRNLHRLIEEFKPDLIHTHTFKAGLLIRISKKSVPIIHSFHGHHLYDPEFGRTKVAVLNVVERRLAKRSAAIVTVGKRVMNELLEVGIGEKSQYHSIAPGIRDTRKEYPKLEKSGFSKSRIKSLRNPRAEFEISECECVVMWLGRFTKVKRPDLVLEIAKALPSITFVMAGGGELLDSCRASAPKNVKLLGFQDKDEMWQMADIGLCTSDSEGMPLSLIEAHMAGVPVVSTDVGSISEIVLDGKTGKLASDFQGLIDSVLWVKNEIDKSDTLGVKAREHALANFTIEKVASSHLNLYMEVMDKVSQ